NNGKKAIQFEMDDKTYTCNLDDYSCKVVESGTQEPQRNWKEFVAPNGKKAVFIKDYNLWLHNFETGDTTQLTFDGEKNYGYATNNAGWTRSERPVVLWSPNSQRIATFQHDSRGVGEMYLVSTNVGHPKLEKWKYPLPGDSVVFKIEREVINLKPKPEVVRLQMEPDFHRSTVSDHIANWSGEFLDVQWSDDSEKLAFVSSSRDHKKAHLQIADPDTGKVRSVLKEEVDTFFESGYSSPNWRVLFDSGEVIWYSQRDDWGHLYLYDLETGKLKHQITKGDWRVLEILRLDEENRKIYFIGSAREEGNPYYHYLYSIGLDGENLQLLTPKKANHSIRLFEDENYFVDTYSTPVEPPVSVLRNFDGEKLFTLAEADISELKAIGWQPPVQFKVKARDGKTNLYGLLYKPSNFDPSKSYPIINYLYPGPQTGSVGSRSFRPSRHGSQALAELGFIVVEVDAMGTPGRSKSFHEFYYGNMGDNGIPDQIATIKQLAAEREWMDLDRVGIWGHSGGGYASTRAILAYPDFYKVAVSESGNHDNRNYEDDWGEKWQGLLVENPDGSTNYDGQANQLLAENLEGKLLLVHGTMDSNVPPYNTLLVVKALIEANKDFDLLMFPNSGHGYGNYGHYMTRRRWDYFVRNLKGAEPPEEYEIGEG
ncbi:MAG TPA: DPP IV N-terminal domain-containing protein, partial [Salinimicrobium sp.]|nr:DPP IV N-terminal domain-containing protein [Salinimicrobium sp.]